MMYSLSFIFSLLALCVWILLSEKKIGKLFRSFFFLAFGSYLYSIFWAQALIDYKLSILFRDLLLISGIAAVFSLLRSQPSALVILVLGISLLYVLHFREVLETTFSGNKESEPPTLSEIELASGGELLLQMKKGRDISSLAALFQRYGLHSRPAFKLQNGADTDLDDYRVIDVPSSRIAELASIKRNLLKHTDVLYLEENEMVRVEPLDVSGSFRKKPNDFRLSDPHIPKLWAFESMDMGRFYQYLRSRKGKAKKQAHLIILDTGVDGSHEDLAANYHSINESYDKDEVKHGTHCAGIAAAVSNNEIGIASFAMNGDYVKVSSVKVLNDFGGGSQVDIINGILEAANLGADVISMSLGGKSNDRRQKAYEEAVAFANNKGSIVVVAAGNSSGDASRFVPANVEGVITVAAIDTSLNRAAFSNHIKNVSRGIAAPGVNIYSTIPGDKYTFYSGTSMATPYVAGLVAVIRSLHPHMDTDEVYRLLHDTGMVIDDTEWTGRLIQAGAAVRGG